MQEFILNTHIILGKEGLDELLDGVEKAFIVTDKFLHRQRYGEVPYGTYGKTSCCL